MKNQLCNIIYNKHSGISTQLSQKASLWSCFSSDRKSLTSNFNRGLSTSPSHNTKALTIWQDVKELRRSPLPALTLGLSGLIPFVSAPLYMLTQEAFMPGICFAQVAYGASILSFLGGVRWGFTLPESSPVAPDWINLGYSVMPSLVAWVGLMIPAPWSLLTVMSGLGIAAYADMSMYAYPAWFKGLRFLLSSVAMLALWTTFMCSYLMPQPVDKPAAAGDVIEEIES